MSCCQPVGRPPVLNAMPDGDPCAQCVGRVLAHLPALLPSTAEEADETSRVPVRALTLVGRPAFRRLRGGPGQD